MDAKRYHHINVVKLIVKKMLPFHFAETAEFRLFVKMLDQKEVYKVHLHSKTVKKIIFELYSSTTTIIKKGVSQISKGTTLPPLDLNLDLWKFRTSHEKYVGIRVFFVNDQWEMKSYLLGIRLLRPSYSISELQMFDLLKRWCENGVQ